MRPSTSGALGIVFFLRPHETALDRPELLATQVLHAAHGQRAFVGLYELKGDCGSDVTGNDVSVK